MPNCHDFYEFWNQWKVHGSFIFQNFQNPRGKNLGLQVKMCFASKILPQGRTDFTDTTVFIFFNKQHFFSYA